MEAALETKVAGIKDKTVAKLIVRDIRTELDVQISKVKTPKEASIKVKELTLEMNKRIENELRREEKERQRLLAEQRRKAEEKAAKHVLERMKNGLQKRASGIQDKKVADEIISEFKRLLDKEALNVKTRK